MIFIFPKNMQSAVSSSLFTHVNLLYKTNLISPKLFINIQNKSSEYTEKFDCIYYRNYFDLLKKLFVVKQKKIFIIDLIQFFQIIPLIFFKSIKTIFWVQGNVPEESFMRNGSKIRFKILTIIERLSMRFSDSLIFVSESMKTYYLNKYSLDKNNVIIPCSSDFYHENNTNREKKMVYIGGISEWQKIDRVFFIFNKVLNYDSSFKLDIITRDIKKAKLLLNYDIYPKLINKVNFFTINNRNEIPKVLKNYRFGFLLRDNSPVNLVSSPIKFAEYLSCGVNVIISDAIPHFAEQVSLLKSGYSEAKILEDITLVDKYSSQNSYKHYNSFFEQSSLIEKYKIFLNSF